MNVERYNQNIEIYNQILEQIEFQKPFHYHVESYHVGHATLKIKAEKLNLDDGNITRSWLINFSPVQVMYLWPSWEDTRLELLDHEQACKYLREFKIEVGRPLPGLVFRALPEGKRILIQCSSVNVSDVTDVTSNNFTCREVATTS